MTVTEQSSTNLRSSITGAYGLVTMVATILGMIICFIGILHFDLGENDIVTLSTSDSMYTYVFILNQGNLIFQKELSSEITVYKNESSIEDGTVFRFQGDN